MLVDAISEGVQTAMTPEHWKVYDRLLLVDPPKELAYYKDLETIDFDASFDEMRRAAKRTPLASIPLIVISKGRYRPACRRGFLRRWNGPGPRARNNLRSSCPIRLI